MSLFYLLILWEKLVEVFDVDEGPRDVVFFPGGLEPSEFGQETGCAVEDCMARSILGSLYTLWIASRDGESVLHEYCEVFKHCRCMRDFINRFEGVLSVGAV